MSDLEMLNPVPGILTKFEDLREGTDFYYWPEDEPAVCSYHKKVGAPGTNHNAVCDMGADGSHLHKPVHIPPDAFVGLVSFEEEEL